MFITKRPYLNLKLNGNITDSGTGQNSGTNSGVTFTADEFGRSNMAADFDSRNDYISFSSAVAEQVAIYRNSASTISFFINISSLNASANNIVSAYNSGATIGFQHYITSTNSANLISASGTGGVYNNTATTGTWMFIVATTKDFDATQVSVEMYKNSTLSALSSGSDKNAKVTPTTGLNSLRIGNTSFASTSGMTAKLNNFKIYDKNLSLAQIKVLNIGKGRLAS